MAETLGERDEDLLAELQAAGYTHDTIVLAEITPQEITEGPRLRWVAPLVTKNTGSSSGGN